MRKDYYPFCVQIELVQGCNRECEFCGTMGIERKFHSTSAATISRTAKLLKKAGFSGRILLAGHGEPTLHAKLPECIRILRRELPKVQITMFTNGIGVLKNPQLLHEVFDAGLNAVMFDEYTDNRIEARVMSLPGIKKYKIEKLAPGVPIFDKASREQRVIIAPPIDGKQEMMSRKLCNHCGAGMPPLEKPAKRVCSIIFRDFFIRWDGGVAICCNDFRGEYPVTNIMDCDSFEEAYYHPRLEAARRRLMQKDRNFHPCSICNVSPLRPGLLPDKAGKTKMPLPTAEDYKITQERHKPLAVIRKRDWEDADK